MDYDREITVFKKLTDSVKRFTTQCESKIKQSIMNDTPPGFLFGAKETPTVAAIQSFNRRYPLSSILPYESYDPETRLYWNKDSVGFALVGAPATGIDLNSIKSLNGMLCDEHKTNAILQMSLLSSAEIEPILEKWAAAKYASGDDERDEVFKNLTKNRMAYCNQAKWESLYKDEPFVLRDFYLVISYTIPNEFNTLQVEDETLLQRSREAFLTVLDSAGIHCTELKPSLFIQLVGGFLNPSQERRVAKKYDPFQPLDQQITEGDMRFVAGAGASTIEKEGERFTLMPFHAEQYPESWSGTGNGDLIGSFTNVVQRLPCHFIMTFTVLFPDNVSQKGRVNAKATRAIQMAETPIAKYNTTFEKRKRDWLYVLGCLGEGDKIVKGFFQINLLLKEGSERFTEEKVKSVFNGLGWKLTKSRFMPVQALLGALPMGISVETRKFLVRAGHFPDILTTNCTRLAPWVAEYKGNKTPIMLFAGRRGQLLYFDPFDNKQGNYNISCCAASGAGKSFVTQEWCMSILGFGGRCYVIDSGGSYENICELLNGTYVDVGKGGLCFNPFTHCTEDDNDFFMQDQMPMLKAIFAEMASPDKPATAEERAILERAILEAWKNYKTDATPTSVYQSLEHIQQDDVTAAEIAGSLRNRLRPYTKHGSYSVFFEGENNVDLSNRFVVLELDALSGTPDLRAVVLFIIMMNITREMYLSGDKSVRKLAIIDEAWKLLGKGSAGDFIEEGFRVARKHGGSFMTITQSPGDYYKSPVAKAAYDQSDFSIFLRLKSDTINTCVENKYLDGQAAALIRTLNTVHGKYSEMMIKSPQGMFVVRFMVDPISSILYATQAQDLQFIREQRKQGKSIMDSVYKIRERQLLDNDRAKRLAEVL